MCSGNSITVPPRRSPYNKRRTAPITHEQARQAALRLIHSHFGQPDHARVTIPAQLDDDDILICDYIEQQQLKDFEADLQQRNAETSVKLFGQGQKPVTEIYTGEAAEKILPKEQ